MTQKEAEEKLAINPAIHQWAQEELKAFADALTEGKKSARKFIDAMDDDSFPLAGAEMAKLVHAGVGTQLTLGGLIMLLERENPEHEVTFGFGYPYRLCSYRGFYDQLAIMFQPFAGSERFETASTFLQRLRDAVGEMFTGYKGGDFVMHKETPLWVVAQHSAAPDLAPVNVRPIEYKHVLIETAIIDAY